MQRFQVLALGLDTLHTRKIWIRSSLVRVCRRRRRPRRRDPVRPARSAVERGLWVLRDYVGAGLPLLLFLAGEGLGRATERRRTGDLVSQLDLRAFSLSGLHDTPDTSLMYPGQVGSLVLQLFEGIRKTS